MKTPRTSAKRLMVLALMPLMLTLISACKQPAKNMYLTTPVSRPFELAAFESDPAMQKLRDLIAGATGCENDSAQTCYVGYILPPVKPPAPCPKGQCIPFWEYPMVSFYSEKDTRPVEVYLNQNFIGNAVDVSYDAKRKLRTVRFDHKTSLPNARGNGNDILTLKIPVTYSGEVGKHFQTVLVASSVLNED